MPLSQQRPILYAITSGATNSKTTPDDLEFLFIVHLVRTAVFLQIPLFQIREKNLPARKLYELVSRAVEITRGSATRLLVNDRFDVALATGADGVHLTSVSLPTRVVREVCGPEFVIGVSTHSLDEARAARDNGADFCVFGPVFETESKRSFGPPQGLERLKEVVAGVPGFPVLAIGGVSIDNAESCFAVGASGFAGISWFNAPDR
ncbi:MAG TPA: thiamine phosphate synthase [Pyrinomonadaceae bacterium]|nr:thiamine phosphate synthase [Pyrinomonadaceae bacterium]